MLFDHGLLCLFAKCRITDFLLILFFFLVWEGGNWFGEEKDGIKQMK